MREKKISNKRARNCSIADVNTLDIHKQDTSVCTKQLGCLVRICRGDTDEQIGRLVRIC